MQSKWLVSLFSLSLVGRGNHFSIFFCKEVNFFVSEVIYHINSLFTAQDLPLFSCDAKKTRGKWWVGGIASLLKNSLTFVIPYIYLQVPFYLSFRAQNKQIISSVAKRKCVVSQFLHCVVCHSLEGIEAPFLRPQLQMLNGVMPVIYWLLEWI